MGEINTDMYKIRKRTNNRYVINIVLEDNYFNEMPTTRSPTNEELKFIKFREKIDDIIDCYGDNPNGTK